MAEEPRGRPEIIYALIIRGPNVVLADHTRLTGNFQHATIQILSKLDRTQEELKSYIYGDYAFHYVIDQTLDLWFICMAERQLLRRIPFAFLSDMQDSFRRRSTSLRAAARITWMAWKNNALRRLQHETSGYNFSCVKLQGCLQIYADLSMYSFMVSRVNFRDALDGSDKPL
eukprot:TRINITY_DN6812_c2_g2_i1.p1 TRINITY_DN6812_c2_g2~~TRINITY_DN6812_c2_g2_i1.p1  ORF type:complete len:172 (-),score=11.47 TRINITY_DN6812_c2_g2_i1:11-526(-)